MAEDDKNPVSDITASVQKSEQSKGVRFVSKAAPPIKPVSTYGLAHHRDTATQIPPDPPSDLPSDLWPSTLVILAKARKAFADQRQIAEMCLHVTSEMTPLLLSAIRTGRISPRHALSAMEGVLHSILVYNDDGVKSGFPGLSDKAYRVQQELRNSDNWLNFATIIADASSEQSPDNVPSESMDRRISIEAFIDRVSAEAGRKLNRKDIWLVAGYQDATEFERFQRNDPRTTDSAVANFRRVLCMESKNFISVLQSKQEQQKSAKK